VPSSLGRINGLLAYKVLATDRSRNRDCIESSFVISWHALRFALDEGFDLARQATWDGGKSQNGNRRSFYSVLLRQQRVLSKCEGGE
jgi:hypothetical protein